MMLSNRELQPPQIETPIGTALEAVDALFFNRATPSIFAARAQLEEVGVQFVLVLKVLKQNRHSISVRVPWQQILGLVSVERSLIVLGSFL